MRAIQVQSLTGPEGLAVVDLPEPRADGGVLIEVRAVGVSFADLLVSQGLYQVRQEPPFVPGTECAGVVREAPAGSRLAPGDRVCAYGPGAFQEVVRRPREATFELPDRMSFEQATG